MRRCQLAEGCIHEVDHEKMQCGVAAHGPGTMGERVVRRGVGERLPGKVTWGRVVSRLARTGQLQDSLRV